MAKKFTELNDMHMGFISAQKIFFAGTAAKNGFVNVSPKGMDTLRVLNPKRIIWLNLTGSGNETAAHILSKNRITLMFCAFEGKPLILRVYGKANMYYHTDVEWEEMSGYFPHHTGARQIFDIEIDMVTTSCGMSVPLMDFKRERKDLEIWAEKKGEERLKEYWREKNVTSLDGLETGIEKQL